MRKYFTWLVLFFSFSALASENQINDGDLVRISVYGNPDLTTEVKVSSEGNVNFPLLGEVKLSGLSPSGAEQFIGARLIQDGFLRQAQVNLIVLQSTGEQVSVLGQVTKPGKYSIETGATTLFDFIALSGGVSAKGSYIVTVLRMKDDPPRRLSINVDKLLLSSGASQINQANMEMNAGDIIYVPEAPVFYVYGEANRPGVYRFKPGMNVAQAIASGGGVSSRGTESGITIKRRGDNGSVIELEATTSTIIYADDVITLKESLF